MTSPDFAAAQQRIADRRQLRAAAQVQLETRQQHAAPTRLPFPLSSVYQSGRNIWGAVEGREGTRPAFRVGQVDAELLDEELLELLRGQVGEALKYFGVCLQLMIFRDRDYF